MRKRTEDKGSCHENSKTVGTKGLKFESEFETTFILSLSLKIKKLLPALIFSRKKKLLSPLISNFF
jgi:hypothetical protein